MDTPTQPPAQPTTPPPPATFSPLFQMMVNKLCNDMKFVGLITIIFGGLYCLTIFGALIGVPLLIGGIRLRESADSFMYFLTTKDLRMLENALERQSRYFFIQKVILIIGIVVLILYVMFIIAFGLSMLRLMRGGLGV
ncbi:MAG: DUF5362 family protein [Bacteroidota bacterium]